MNESAEQPAYACCGSSIYRLPLIVLREEGGRFIMSEGKKTLHQVICCNFEEHFSATSVRTHH